MASLCGGGKLSVGNECVGSGGGGGGGGESVVVYLLDNAMTPVDIPITDDQGSYFLVVVPVNFPGATATFAASNSSPATAGSVARVTNSPSPTNEEIDITWTIGNVVQLFHSVVKTGGTGALIPYLVTVYAS